jgi:DNA-binding GntR family transcriptional regulator
MNENLKTKAYRIIKEKIITCEYYPNMYSNEEFLQKDLQLSRTPLRDALGRLEQEGFITIKPKKGMIVTDITVEVINQLFEAKSLAEEYGIRTYGDTMDRAVLLDFRRRFEEEWDPENIKQYKKRNELYKIYDVDFDFHMYISNSTGNKYIGKLLEDIKNHDIRVRYYTGMIVEPNQYLSKGETENIIDSLLNRRIEDAIMYSKLHMATAKNASLMAWINK